MKCIKGICTMGIGFVFIYLIHGGIYYGFKIFKNEVTIEQIQREFFNPIGFALILFLSAFYVAKKIDDKNEEKNNSPN